MLLRKTDRDIPVYVTEEGVPDSDRGQDAQAQYLTAVVNALKSSTYIKGIWWFCLINLSTGHANEDSYGLLDSDYNPKPSYYAMQRVVSGFLR